HRVKKTREICAWRAGWHDEQVRYLCVLRELFVQVFLDGSPLVQKVTEAEGVRQVENRVQPRPAHVCIDEQNTAFDFSESNCEIGGNCSLSFLGVRTGDDQNLRLASILG